MSTPIEVLFVDDEEHLRIATSQTLELAGYQVRTTNSAQEALAVISRTWRGILVSDIRMPDMDGMELLREAIAIDADLPVVLVTGHGDINLAVEAMREGAYDFIEKPFTTARFLDSVTRALEKRELTLENRQLRDSVALQVDNLDARLAGRSKLMCAVRKQVRTIAATTADVMIIGETGTGKEITARAIHDLSSGEDRPFVAINCAALPAEMIEAELFGYEAGAFAGATRARFGKFEHARNGTIFLDKIESMPPGLQAKLLRVVQERAVTRLNSNEVVPLNARFIAASSVDLEQSTEEEFRKDLLYRLNVTTLHLPPLSERREDIPSLFMLLLRIAATKFRTSATTPPDNYMSMLSARDWPGNVRELRNAAERYVLGIEHSNDQAKPSDHTAALKNRVTEFERQAIAEELRTRNGNLKAVYETLGLSRKTLYEKMQKYGLTRDEFRNNK